MIISVLIFLIIGLVTGSFLSMLTYRLPRELSLGGRSYCDHCGKKISWYENIPLFSYLLLKGKCKNCSRHISLRYPLIELTMGILFVLCFYLIKHPTDPFFFWLYQTFGDLSLPFLLLVATCCVSLLVIDLETQLLPDILLFILLMLVIVFCFLLPSPRLFIHLFWGFLSSSFFLLIYLLTRERGMGFGDVKLSFVAGFLLGFPYTLVWILLSFLSGSIVGLILLALKKVKPGQPIPFGPFLLGSLLLTLTIGGNIFIWYVEMLTNS
jgi:prepilin signal peptidase PulO-like enzyme (type II secretory pathway)